MNGEIDLTPPSGLRGRFTGRRPLRRAFLAAFLLATMIPLAAYAVASYTAMAAALHKQEHRQMVDRARSILVSLDARRSQLRGEVRSYSEGWPQLATAIRRHDVRWLRANATDWVIANQGIQVAQVFDLHGHAVSLAGDLTGQPLGASRLARLALHTRLPQEAYMVLGGRLYAVAAETVTVANPPAPAAGLLVFAVRLDGPTFTQLAGIAGVESVTAYADGRRITAAPEAPLLAAAERAGQRVGEVHAVGSDMVHYERLPTDGTPVTLRVGVQLSSVAAAESTLLDTALWSLLVAVGIALAVGLLLAHRVIRPLRRLARATLDMAHGQTRQHLTVPRWEELADVATAFNSMSERVSQEMETLSRTMGGLSQEIGRLTEFGETLAQTRDVAAELEHFAKMVAQVFEAGSARIYLWRSDRFILGAAYGDSLEDDQAADLATAAASQCAPVARGDAATVGASVVAVPILHCQETIGVVVIGSGSDRLYRREDISMLAAIASQMAIALKHGEAYEKLDRSYLETVKGLAGAMEAKDQYTAEHGEKARRDGPRRRAPAGAGRGGASPTRIRRCPARRRQDRRARPHPEQTGQAQRGGVRRDGPPHHHRGGHHLTHRLPAPGRPDRALGPRALGWTRLPRWAGGRGHPPGLAHRLRLRRLPRHDVRPALPQRSAAGDGARGASLQCRPAVRPPNRGGLPRGGAIVRARRGGSGRDVRLGGLRYACGVSSGLSPRSSRNVSQRCRGIGNLNSGSRPGTTRRARCTTATSRITLK